VSLAKSRRSADVLQMVLPIWTTNIVVEESCPWAGSIGIFELIYNAPQLPLRLKCSMMTHA
jgi:hypothetical protein